METGRDLYVSVERRAESVDLESGERRRDKNSNCSRLKLGYLKNRQEYTWNIPKSAKNSKKIGPISVGYIGYNI
jgi:hypothetical protein